MTGVPILSSITRGVFTRLELELVDNHKSVGLPQARLSMALEGSPLRLNRSSCSG